MNYNYQTDGLTVNGKTVVDYARHPVGRLVESSLLEPAAFAPAGDTRAQTGLASYTNLILCAKQSLTKDKELDCDSWRWLKTGSAASGLDFNDNRIVDQTPVSADLNGTNGTQDVYEALEGDWEKRLRFDGLPRSKGRVAVVDLDDDPIVPCKSAPNTEVEDLTP
jgi:hypothetical protein